MLALHKSGRKVVVCTRTHIFFSLYSNQLGFLSRACYSSLDKLSTEHKKREKTCKYEWNVHMYYKSNLLFENILIARIDILLLMHSVSAKDKDLTVIRILYSV